MISSLRSSLIFPLTSTLRHCNHPSNAPKLPPPSGAHLSRRPPSFFFFFYVVPLQPHYLPQPLPSRPPHFLTARAHNGGSERGAHAQTLAQTDTPHPLPGHNNEPRSATRCPSLIIYLFVTHPIVSGNPSSDAGHNSVELCDLLKKNMKGVEGMKYPKEYGSKGQCINFSSLFFFLSWVFKSSVH